MKLKPNIVILLLLLLSAAAYGQMNQYDYQREIKGITGQWHQLTLPDEVFSKVSDRLNDIRIYGITPGKDTLEAAYLLNQTIDKVVDKEVASRILNVSHNGKGYYFTLEVSAKEPVNQLMLDFKEKNFDWKVKVEGSQDQQEWFTVIDNYRILSIHNEFTDYKFNKVAFPTSSYRYFRLLIATDKESGLLAARVSQQKVMQGNYKNYPIRSVNTTQIKADQQTQIAIDLPSRVPVSSLKINVTDTFDYYRPVTIEYVTDSVKTEKGWKYNYRILGSGTLNSLEENEFTFTSTLVQKIKVYIGNHDNQPLAIGSVEAKGPHHELVIRFTQPANYFLVYGNNRAQMPEYDLEQFKGNIPVTLIPVELGIEQSISKKINKGISPLFQNKAWLWLIMGVIIALLGGFTVNLLRKKEKIND